ncbi:acyl-CoA dehydrogenase family protein, partial [Desulfocastanea catecholica]
GIADILIVYAKVDGEKFTAFIVDGDSEGLSIGAEEVKMGLKGSSTCSVFFDNVKVPAENLLFETGKGHVVA